MKAPRNIYGIAREGVLAALDAWAIPRKRRVRVAA
jgi:hypothetical protein